MKMKSEKELLDAKAELSELQNKNTIDVKRFAALSRVGQGMEKTSGPKFSSSRLGIKNLTLCLRRASVMIPQNVS